MGSENNTALVDAAFGNDNHTLKLLLASGVDVDQTDEYGSTALHWAANHGNTCAVMALLAAGADVYIKDLSNQSALYLAIDNGHSEVVRLLEEAERGERRRKSGAVVSQGGRRI